MSSVLRLDFHFTDVNHWSYKFPDHTYHQVVWIGTGYEIEKMKLDLILLTLEMHNIDCYYANEVLMCLIEYHPTLGLGLQPD